MRKIYTTPRVENADRVVQLFADNGIAARITNDGGWRGRDHRRFSYIGDRKRSAWPEVWVIRAEDQPRARALLREIGIEPTVQYAQALEEHRGTADPVVARRRTTVTRVRRILLAVIGVLVLLTVIRSL